MRPSTVPTSVGDPVPSGAAEALTKSDQGTDALRLSAKGLEVGDHVLWSAGKDGGLLLCDKTGSEYSPLVTVASQVRQIW